MKPFEEQPRYEQLLRMRASEPERYNRLPQSEQNAVEAYEDLKREQTRANRPLRRRYLENSEKATLIASRGQDGYLALPW